MPRPIASVRALLAAAVLLATPVAQHAQSAAADTCAPTSIAGVSAAQRELLTRASLDPAIGCAALAATHHAGDFTVASADTVRGNLVVLDGTLHVAGTVTGSAIALNGAVVVDSTGHVLGDAVAAAHGATIAPNGRIDGELRTIDAIRPATVSVPVGAVTGTVESLKRTAAWFGILILLGIGVLTNSGDAMQRVTAALNAGFGRNVTVGLVAQLALLPVLATLCLMLALTLIGVLLIPFAIVAYLIAVLGLIVLGGLGAAQMVGRGVAARRPGLSERGARLQSLISGMLLLSLPWLAAAALASSPVASAVLRTLAMGITWITVTAGLGAALRTRGGTRSHDEPWGVRRPAPSGTPLPVAQPQPEWLTPTPLTGVVAVKRPSSTTGSGTTR